jgi:hypothetical protein
MGIETLYSAAHAAGFAMAAPEESYEDLAAVPRAGPAGSRTELPWQPSRAVLINETRADRSDWLGTLLGLVGRRTPPRRPALSAEA